MKELDEGLSGILEQSLFICLFDYNYRSFHVYRKLSVLNIPYAVFYTNPFPVPSHYYSPAKKYTHYLKRILQISLKHTLTIFANKFLLRYYPFLGVKPAALCLLGGTKSLDFLNTPLAPTTRKVWMHSLDYDLYLEELSSPEEVDDHLCVFIEAYFPSDPDRYYHESTSTSVFDPDEEYYRDLRAFFSYIEKTAGVRILVAEHPKKHPDLNIVDYGGRERVGGKTAILVKKARFVLSHDSNAINYAILFRKPILFISSEKNDRTSNGQNVRTLSEKLGNPVIFINSPPDFNLDQMLSIDETKYETYIREYIKNSERNIPSWQIFCDFVRDEMT